jgi:hypothetical protein
LNTPPEKRQKNLDEDLAAFPYVNGDLFAARLGFPAFTAAMRQRLLDACAFSWDAISPAIFGVCAGEKVGHRSGGAVPLRAA